MNINSFEPLFFFGTKRVSNSEFLVYSLLFTRLTLTLELTLNDLILSLLFNIFLPSITEDAKEQNNSKGIMNSSYPNSVEVTRSNEQLLQTIY